MALLISIILLLYAVFDLTFFFFSAYFQREKACLGEILHRHMTANEFSPECLVDYLDLSSEHTALDSANRIEAALHIWRQKYQKKKSERRTGRSPWSGATKGLLHMERTRIFAERAETLLRILKLQFPNFPQTALDTIKIQHNKVSFNSMTLWTPTCTKTYCQGCWVLYFCTPNSLITCSFGTPYRYILKFIF